MARNLPDIASAFVRFLQSENRRPFFARRRRLRRFGNIFRRHGRGAVFRRRTDGRGLRHRSGIGGRRRPFVWNRRRHGRRHHGNPRQAFAPRTGRGAQAIALNAHGLQAAPPSPPPPLQPAFQIPPMDWLLGGPAAPLLGEEDDFVAALAPPPYPAYFHGAIFNPPTPSTELEEYEFPPGYGPDAYMDIPTPTPAQSDEDPEHFMPPGFGPVPGLDSPPPVVEAGAPLAAAPFAFDLNVEVEPEDEETGALVGAAPLALDFSVKVEPKD
ncbi:hypothetical protein D1007_14727 [Hordeum vulgare]|nr:hypothetical protein D1007_14727 [Hordeum vulgare]